MLLPQVATYDDYLAFRRRAAGSTIEAARVICQRHGLDASQARFVDRGNHLVFRVGSDYWIKIYALPSAEEKEPEMLSLRAIQKAGELKAPEVIADGEIESWPYVVLTSIPGRPLEDVWEDAPARERIALAIEFGSTIRALHRTPVDGLESLAVDWPELMERQFQSCVENHAAAGAAREWQDMIAEYLAGVTLGQRRFTPALLHSDLSGDHCLVTERHGRWRIEGVLDFGDAMVGDPLYDLVVGGFLMTDQIEARRAWLLAYGLSDREINDELADVLMLYTMLHRFGRLPIYLRQFPLPRPASLREFRDRLWRF